MHDELQSTVVPSQLLVQQHRPLDDPFPTSASAAFPPLSSTSSAALYGHGYSAGPLEYGDAHSAYPVHAPWAPPLASTPASSSLGGAAAPPRTFLSNGLAARLSPSVSPVDGLPAAWPYPSPAAALTVGEVLGLPSASTDERDGQRPFAPLATQAGLDGGFEAEVSSLLFSPCTRASPSPSES